MSYSSVFVCSKTGAVNVVSFKYFFHKLTEIALHKNDRQFISDDVQFVFTFPSKFNDNLR